MKINFLKMGLSGLLIGITLILLSAPEKGIRNGKKEIFLIQQDSKNKIQSDEYKAYRAEQEKKIAENKKTIADLRLKKDKVKKENLSEYETKIDKLEQKNNELNKKIMSNYKDEGKEKWDSFKKKFNHDMDELGHSLKDLFND
jgi:hypothetical protein